jgi:hypothetical protein
MEFGGTPSKVKRASHQVKRVCRFPGEVNRRRDEPTLGRIGVNQTVNPGEQVMVNVVRFAGHSIGRLNEVFQRSVGNHPIECPVPLVWNCAVVKEADVKLLVSAAPQLFSRDGDPDAFDVALPGSLQ